MEFDQTPAGGGSALPAPLVFDFCAHGLRIKEVDPVREATQNPFRVGS